MPSKNVVNEDGKEDNESVVDDEKLEPEEDGPSAPGAVVDASPCCRRAKPR
jgi:hypothetical protein